MQKAWRSLNHQNRVRAALAALCLAAYAPPILGLLVGWWPFGEDALAYFGPLRGWAGAQLRGGTIPLWNPYLFLGQPFAANLQGALWYPPNLLYWLLPGKFAVLLDALGHTIWLAWGGYAFAGALRLGRRSSFLAAVLLALGGATAARVYAGQLIWLAGFAHLPWLLRAELAWLRSGRARDGALAGVCMALVIVAGHPPTALLAALLCAALAALWILTRERGTPHLPRGWAGAAGAFAGMALLLSAVVWLPFRELSKLAEHGGALGFQDATVLSASWKSFVRLIAPEWFGGNRGVQWSATCCSHEEVASLGVWPSVLAFASLGLLGGAASRYTRAARWVWVALPLVAVVALGANTPVYRWLFDALPPLRVVRIPSRWLLVWAFAAPFLAALLWQRAFEERDERLVRLTVNLLRGVALAFAAATAWALLSPESVWQGAAAPFGASTPGLKGAEIAANFRRVALLESGTVFLLAGLAASLVERWRGAAKTGPAALRGASRVLLGFACLECLLGFWRGAKLVSPKDQADAFWPPEMSARYHPGERWATSIFWQGINGSAPAGVALANGYDPLGTKMYFAFASGAEGGRFWETLYQPKRRSPLWRVAGVTHTIAHKRDPMDGETPYPDTRGWTLEAESGRWELWNRHEAAWPRVYLAADVWKTDKPLPLLEKLAGREGGAYPVVVRPSDLTGLPSRLRIGSAILPPGGARILHESPNRITLEAKSAWPSALVVADANYPGWHAYVDGRRTAIADANGPFRAVEVPRGASRTDMVFEPETVRLGWFLSLCGLAGLGFMVQVRPRAAPLEENDESDSNT